MLALMKTYTQCWMPDENHQFSTIFASLCLVEEDVLCTYRFIEPGDLHVEMHIITGSQKHHDFVLWKEITQKNTIKCNSSNSYWEGSTPMSWSSRVFKFWNIVWYFSIHEGLLHLYDSTIAHPSWSQKRFYWRFARNATRLRWWRLVF